MVLLAAGYRLVGQSTECSSPLEAGVSGPAPMITASDDEQERGLSVPLIDGCKSGAM